MRWRTEDEVLSGAGETSCGNTRCPNHTPTPAGPSSAANMGWDDDYTSPEQEHLRKKKKKEGLLTIELPFTYEEDSQAKTALVKVVLCSKCFKKINWKREKDKEASASLNRESKPTMLDGHPPDPKSDIKPPATAVCDIRHRGSRVHSRSIIENKINTSEQ